MHIYFLVLFLLLSSCSSVQPIRSSRKPLDPRTTQQQKRKIKEKKENLSSKKKHNQKVIDLYRRLREKNWKKYTKPKRYQPQIRNYQVERENSQMRSSPLIKKVKQETSSKKQEEMQAEVMQNLSYFCMANRKKRRFSPKSQCKRFTNQVYNECLDLNSGIATRDFVTCVKSRLK